MPLGLAEGLCRRGLCVQYVKVAAAAHYKWQVRDLVVLAQLGMNSSSPATAAAAARILKMLPADLPAGVVAGGRRMFYKANLFSLVGLPACSSISPEQLAGLITAAPESAGSVGLDALGRLPAIRQLSSAAVTSVMTSVIEAAVQPGSKWGAEKLAWLLSYNGIFADGSVAARDGEAIAQWLPPVLKAALQKGEHAFADHLMWCIDLSVVSAAGLLTLLETALQHEGAGNVSDQLMYRTRYSVTAALRSFGRVLHEARLYPAGSDKAQCLLEWGIWWISINRRDKLAGLLHTIVPWLSAQQCEHRLDAAGLTAAQVTALAQGALVLWLGEVPGPGRVLLPSRGASAAALRLVGLPALVTRWNLRIALGLVTIASMAAVVLCLYSAPDRWDRPYAASPVVVLNSVLAALRETLRSLAETR
ncbi:hypothetical protein COO60DRAFT_1637033 [Scenedesmus sp. NREL 46B-D3]|nr:hypothetical protein COO60DRAFT_1637033 [Scenedesmus sp. NREL 46B-D3]